MVNVKTPNKKRKSVGNTEGGSPAALSPKVAKFKTPVKTPFKNKANASPGKFNKTPPNKTPKAGPQQNVKTPKPEGKSPKNLKQTPFKNQAVSEGNAANSPKQTPFKNQAVAVGNAGTPKQTPSRSPAVPGENAAKPLKQTPFKKQPFSSEGNVGKSPKRTPFKKQGVSGDVANTPKQGPRQQSNSDKKIINKNKRSAKPENEGSPPEKLKKFAGTAAMQEAKDKRKQAKKEKKLANRALSKTEKKTKRRDTFGQLKEKLRVGDQPSVAYLEKKIKMLQIRTALTKSAKRKLKILQKLRKLAPGEMSQEPLPKQVVKTKQAKVKNQAKGAKSKVNVKPERKVTSKVETSEIEDDENSESEYEVEAEINPDKIIKTIGGVEEESDEDESGDEEEASGEEEEASGEEEEASGEEEEASGEEEEDIQDESDDDEDIQGAESDDDEEIQEPASDDDEEEKAEKPQANKSKQFKPTETNSKDFNSSPANKKKRFVVFVGNVNYEATTDDVSEHFSKAGQIRHVRIPTDRNTNKPRGFAYVEFDDEVSYQKALSMHHTFIKGRRINVQYSEGGNKNNDVKRDNIRVKNLKLSAMRKQGKLHGSIKHDNKRSVRRAKNKVLNGSN